MSRFRHNSDTHRLVDGLARHCGNDLVRFIAKRLRSTADARDLAHEAYVRLLLVERTDGIRDPRAYLYRIAANILYEYELKRKADAIGLTRWSEWRLLDADLSHLECDVETLFVRKRIEAVLGQLSPKCRAVVILYRRDGMTYEEIGATIRISTSMVKKYVARGLRHCREHLVELREPRRRRSAKNADAVMWASQALRAAEAMAARRTTKPGRYEDDAAVAG